MNGPSGFLRIGKPPLQFSLCALLSASLIACPIAIPIAAQQRSSKPVEEEQTRMLWNTTFTEQRPASAKATAPSSAAAKGQPPAAARKPASGPSADRIGDSLVGVTIWRLRTSEAGDDPAVHIASPTGGEQWTPVRVGADTPVKIGQRVRVSFETARAGYLYVIDREQYADGTYGAASLIFPTLQTHSGNNQVTAGRLIEVPALDDNPPYFTMQPSRHDQVAEVLTVMVTPKPLPGVKIGSNPLAVSPDQLRLWERQWGVQVQRLEAVGQAGKPYTKAEKEASLLPNRFLAHEEPLPQTMYHLDVKPGAPLLFNISLRLAP